MTARGDIHEVRRVFLAALAHEGEARAAFVGQACQRDPRLREEVTALLAAHAQADALLPVPPLDDDRHDLLAVGDRIGEFVIEARLGRGGFGEVYRATQLGLQRPVALKVTRSGDARDGGTRLRREARSLGTVHDPHLVEVYVDGDDPARALSFYAMRFVAGPTLGGVLRQLAAQGPPSAALRRPLVQRCREVCRALAALHGSGLVHRDVAPGNIILEGADERSPWLAPARLLDYGLVRPAHALVSMPLGTLGYAAPEISSTGRVDARVDVFGVGALLHDLLSGRDPTTAPPSPRFHPLRQVAGDIDPDLAAIVARCTANEPSRRYADASELGAELDAWLAGHRTARGRARRRILVCAGLFAATLALGAAASIVVARTDAARRWDDGALVAADAIAHALPLRVVKALVPGPLRAAHGEPVESVLREGARHGEGAALLLAARHLERDGLAAHPLLARFLRWAVEPRSAPPALLPLAHRLAGRLFFERPDGSAADVAESRALAATLAGTLAHLRTEDRVWTLVGLEGCGASTEFAAVAAAAGDPDPETARLAMGALAGIVRRATACGFAPRLHRDGLAAATAAVLRAVRQQHPAPTSVVAPALDWFAVEAIFACRRGGHAAAVATILAAIPTPSALVRAAAVDPALRDELLAHGPTTPEDRNEYAAYGVFQTYGRLLGALGSDDLEPRARALVVAAATARGLDPEFAAHVYASARAELSARRAGMCPEDSPDPDSHLGADLALVPPPLIAAACARVAESIHASILAGWRFDAGGPRLERAATGLQVRAVDFAAPEEVRPDRTFARLAAIGVSTLRFEFELDAPIRAPSLAMLAQKGLRRRLPGDGVVHLEVGLDANAIAHIPLSGGSHEHVRLPLGPLEAGRHTLDVTLRADSTTTLRIVRVAVEQ